MEEKELSHTDLAYSRLEQKIIFQRLEPGAMYSEKQLAELLGMGRTPVREALQKLAWEQLVIIHPRRGIQIPIVTVESQLKLLEVRRVIEALCAGLAAERASKNQKQEMLELADGLLLSSSNQDDESFFYHLRKVHALLVEAAKNDYIREAMRPLQGLSRRFWFIHKGDDTEHPAQLHAQVMKSVASGDPEAARKAANRVIDYLQEFAIKQLG